MSRVAKNPVKLPSGVQVQYQDRVLSVKGKKGQLEHRVPESVDLEISDQQIQVRVLSGENGANALGGTTRALIYNMVTGVDAGFERKLVLVGVGYRAQAKGDTLSLSLGFSHPLDLKTPQGISVETPSQTEIIVRGIDKQKVGQFAAKIREWRPPEPYKGKGIRYTDETVLRKEAKKK